MRRALHLFTVGEEVVWAKYVEKAQASAGSGIVGKEVLKGAKRHGPGPFIVEMVYDEPADAATPHPQVLCVSFRGKVIKRKDGQPHRMTGALFLPSRDK